jgi:cytochrome oxidase assembly protein ShyY1
MTYLLGWCAVSIAATLIALAMIRAGKRRQPEADDVETPASD